MMHGWGIMNWGWGNMFFTLFFWFVVIGLIVWGIKTISQRNAASQESALEILKKRYARGEIDKKEFEQKKKDLL